eukprot:6247866-Amphidinium_carterae.3
MRGPPTPPPRARPIGQPEVFDAGLNAGQPGWRLEVTRQGSVGLRWRGCLCLGKGFGLSGGGL